MKPSRRPGEPLVAAVSFYLVLQWVAPLGAMAAADSSIKSNRVERSNTDGNPQGGLSEGNDFGANQDHPVSASRQHAGQAAGTAAPRGPRPAVENETQLREAQSRVGPHTMIIESSLRSALGQADGVKAQIHEAEASRADAPLTADQISGLRAAGTELAADLDTVQLHRGQLLDGLQEFPNLSASSEFRSADRAFSELFPAERAWRARMGKPGYWQNRSQVNADLTLLKGRIQAALDATRRFNLARLNIPQSSTG